MLTMLTIHYITVKKLSNLFGWLEKSSMFVLCVSVRVAERRSAESTVTLVIICGNRRLYYLGQPCLVQFVSNQ